MTRIIEQVGLALLALAGVVAFLGVVRSAWPGPRHRCAGPRIPWWLWLWPASWIWRRGCWYDLRQTAPDAEGRRVCPECGCCSPTRGLLRRPQRLRVAPLVVLMLVAGLAAQHVRWLRAGMWARSMPTVALVLMERGLGGWSPNACRWQLRERLERDRLSTWSRRQLAAAAVHELGDDGRDWNAYWAMDVLGGLRSAALPPLLNALESRDYQRRQLAAHLLRGMAMSEWHGPPEQWRVSLRRTPELIRVTVEGLRDDELPRGGAKGRRHQTWVFNANDGVEFLVAIGPDPAASAALGDALASGDAQQALLAAVVIGWTGEAGLYDRAVPLLIRHLQDNSMSADARASVRALAEIGPAIIPHLNAAEPGADPQQTSLMQLLALGLVWPDAPRWLRDPLNTVTIIAADPTTGMSLDQSVRHLE